jgi:hypothetical protein
VLVPTFTPGMLDAYARCPLQFRRKYVEKRMPPQDFSRDLACGIAAHEALQWALGIYRRTGGYPIDIRQRVEDALPAASYADAADYAADVEKIICWVKSGLGGIDETAHVLQVERWMEYRFPGCAECPPFLLRHRVDVVMEHGDGGLEHRDWKTGARAEVDEMQNVAARIVVKTAFPDRDRILSSTAFLARDIVQIDELTRDEVRAVLGAHEAGGRRRDGRDGMAADVERALPVVPALSKRLLDLPHDRQRPRRDDGLAGGSGVS